MRKSFSKSRIQGKDVFAFLGILYIVLSSYSVYYMVAPDSIKTASQFGVLILGFGSFAFHFFSNKVRLHSFLLPIVISGVFFVALLLNRSEFRSYMYIFLRFVAVFYFVVVLHDLGVDIIAVLVKAIFVLACYNLACYVIFDLLFPSAGLSYYIHLADSISSGTTASIHYESHFGIYYRWAIQSPLFSINLPRASGFCWEGGQYQIYLNLALLYMVHYEKKMSLWKIAILIVSIITTFSAMGFMVTVVIVLAKVIKGKHLVTCICGVLAAIPVSIYAFLSIINDKKGSVSYTVRTSQFQYLPDIFLRNGFFGSATQTSDFSSGLVQFLWDFGYVSFFLLIFIAIAYIRNKSFISSKVDKALFLFWIIMSLLNEPIQYTSFVFLIAALMIYTPTVRKSAALPCDNTIKESDNQET